MEKPLRPVEEVLSEWLSIAVERFQQSLKENKIGVTSSLFNSFLTNIIKNSEGKASRIEIEFLFYGRYVDMGVGKGFPIGSRGNFKDFNKHRKSNGQLHQVHRKPKKWYSKTKAYEIGKLTDLLAEQYGMQTAKAVESALDNNKFIIEM